MDRDEDRTPARERGFAAPREIHVKDLWEVVARRWRLVALLTLLVTVGAWLAGRGAIPRFQSQLTVQVSSAKQVFPNGGDKVDELALKTDPILSEALVLTTQALALRVVADLGLELEIADPSIRRGDVMHTVRVDTSDYQLGTYDLVQRQNGWELRDGGGVLVTSGAYADPVVGPGFSFVAVPPRDGEPTVRFSAVRPEAAAAWVRGGISYNVVPETNALSISFTGIDPTLVPVVLNRAAVELRLDGTERARAAAMRKREFIEGQLRDAEAQLQAKLGQVQQFKETNQITDLSTEERSLVEQIGQFEGQRQQVRVQVATLDDILADARADTLSVETLNRLAAVEGIQNNTALDFQINRILELQEERRSLTAGALGLRPDNPQVQGIDQRLHESQASLRSAIAASLESLRRQVQSIDTKIGELRTTLMGYPGKETRIAQLQLEANILEETNRYLLGQYQQARMEEATITPYVTILDGASPASIIGTNIKQKIVLGFLVGLLLGLGGAFFLEYLDQTIKDAADVERAVGTPVLGRIPLEARLAATGNGRRRPIVVLTDLDPEDPAVEAYRALRTNVTFVGAERPIQFVAVTSPGPSEGKSTTAANLAITLAQGGNHTLLVDGDLRRPQMHHAFGLVDQPGLTDMLVGQADRREAVRPNVLENLDVLPAGSRPPNPSELLGSESMQGVIGQLRRDYDYIVIDTPPTLPVTDSAVVAAIADATILVMRSGETEEDAAQRAVEQLHRVRARVAGTVLNGVNPKNDRYYTYYSSGGTSSHRRKRGKLLRSGIAAML